MTKVTKISETFNDLKLKISEPLVDFVDESSNITEAYVALRKDKKPWTLHEQLLHINSEVSEAYELLRRGDPEELDLLFEELTDVLLSSATAVNILILQLMDKKPHLYPDEKALRYCFKLNTRRTVNKVIHRLQSHIEELENARNRSA